VRFTLLDILLATAVVATSLGTFGRPGVAVAWIVLGVFACIRSAKSKWEAVRNVAAILFAGLCLIALLVVASGVRPPPYRLACVHRLKQLGVALHNYHDRYGCFPPAYLADAAGDPMHSWRVLLLPYLEERDLYEQYDFAELWDGSNNSKLCGELPGYRLSYYACPENRTAATPAVTSYLAVTEPNTAWCGSQSIRLDDIRDGPDNTIILAEAVNSGIDWSEPRDLTLEQALWGINPQSGLGISSRHRRKGGFFGHDVRGAYVLLADGTVRFLPEDTPPETLRALLTIDGGEDVDIHDVEYTEPRGTAYRPTCLSLIAWVISVGVFLARAWVKV